MKPTQLRFHLSPATERFLVPSYGLRNRSVTLSTAYVRSYVVLCVYVRFQYDEIVSTHACLFAWVHKTCVAPHKIIVTFRSVRQATLTTKQNAWCGCKCWHFYSASVRTAQESSASRVSLSACQSICSCICFGCICLHTTTARTTLATHIGDKWSAKKNTPFSARILNNKCVWNFNNFISH